MQSINHRVIDQISDWLAKGSSVWLMTIVETYGASPRPPGSICAYCVEEDRVVGSLSGGCIEDDLLRELKLRQLQQTFTSPVHPEEKIYGETQEEQSRLQLPCGGRLRLVVEHIESGEQTIEHFNSIKSQLNARKRVQRSLCKKTGSMTTSNELNSVDLSDSDELMVHPMGPAYRMLIIGVSEVTRYLVPLAESVDIQVAVCDPREAFADRSQLDLDLNVITSMPDDVVREQYTDRYCAIVALAHDPRVDDMALLEALTTDAFFIGAMGSARTSSNRRVRLKELGITDSQLSRLHAPIGVDMGSKTPPEIAISVIAQVVQERNRQESADLESILSVVKV